MVDVAACAMTAIWLTINPATGASPIAFASGRRPVHPARARLIPTFMRFIA